MTNKQAVAKGNGLTTKELPAFKRHSHPETGEGEHTSWGDCVLSYCTWVGQR